MHVTLFSREANQNHIFLGIFTSKNQHKIKKILGVHYILGIDGMILIPSFCVS